MDKRSNGHGRVNLIISGYRGGLDIYKGPSPPDDTLSHNTLLHLSPHDDTRIYNVSRDTGSVLSVNVLSRVVRSLFELLKQNIRCKHPNIFDILAKQNVYLDGIERIVNTLKMNWDPSTDPKVKKTDSTGVSTVNNKPKLLTKPAKVPI